MEINRLKTMKPHDSKVFNELYNKTRGLTKSLAMQIDARRFGVDRTIIESWFDDKFIFVFNKYYGEVSNEMLLGYIINSLKTFKYRVMRKAYTEECLFLSSTVDMGEDNELINIIPDESEMDTRDTVLELIYSFMKKNLSDDAYLVFELQTSPPPYIINKLARRSGDIPLKYIIDFLDLEEDSLTYNYLKQLKEEIAININKAREYFNHPGFAFN